MALKITGVPGFEDNYHWVLECETTGVVALVDPGDYAAVLVYLQQHNLKASLILNTHHHWDHVNGNEPIVKAMHCEVVGAAHDKARIPCITRTVMEGDRVRVGECEAQVLEVWGHTKGHIAYWFSDNSALFSGDVIFSLGCGKLFEGTPEEMWKSLRKLSELPAHTKIFGAHEYTLENAEFAVLAFPQDRTLKEFVAKAKEKRANGKFTIPSLLLDELRLNPFLRKETLASWQTFAAMRAAKDRFDQKSSD